jgi:hypothetical protein
MRVDLRRSQCRQRTGEIQCMDGNRSDTGLISGVAGAEIDLLPKVGAKYVHTMHSAPIPNLGAARSGMQVPLSHT